MIFWPSADWEDPQVTQVMVKPDTSPLDRQTPDTSPLGRQICISVDIKAASIMMLKESFHSFEN
jgi:hypothetical protein